MFVLKRNGSREKVSFDKITSRISKLCYGLNSHVDPIPVAQKTCAGVFAGVTTAALDELAAETAAHMTSIHPDYGVLASRISVSNLHKSTKKIWSDVMDDLHRYVEPRTGEPAALISDKVYAFVQANKDALNSAILYDRDFRNYDYFGFKTMERSYLLKLHGKIVERPQHMLMRCAVGIHHEKDSLAAALETYTLISDKWFTHASPTLFNASMPKPQMSSCFLLVMKDDSIDGIYDTAKQCAQISKEAGGIGVSVHNIRAKGSYIRGTNGTSNGLVPMLRVFDTTAQYVDQGGGKRKGSFAIYLSPWHADIYAFLDLRKNDGTEELRARNLFYGLWIPDLFMKRVEDDKEWSLFCPKEAPGLSKVSGDAFVKLYERYEKTPGKARKVVRARHLWEAILEAQTETGLPYFLYADSCNAKSNQRNLGTIENSNLCTEIIQKAAADEVAVCNLASVALPMFVTGDEFDHKKLFEVTRVVVRNLNNIIEINHYPVEEARRSNMRHRPIGIGVQGMAEMFILLRMPYDSPAAKRLNRDVFETMYFAALTESCALAKTHGPYESYTWNGGCPVSHGELQFDAWKVEPSDRWDWKALRADIKQHGVRNSLLLAPMPTASTSQILGNTEAFEPINSNIYVRRTLAGEYVVVNRYLLKDLIALGLWNKALKNKLVAHGGSVQKIDEIPANLKALYKTVWEISMRHQIDMAADRGAFICQSQSFNVHMLDVDFGKLTSMHFYAWKKGLKTGCYYLRTRAAVNPIQFTVDAKALREEKQKATPESVQVGQASPVTPAASPVTSPGEASPATPGAACPRRIRGTNPNDTHPNTSNAEACLSCGS